MLKLRLKRFGRKKQACYRIVATDSRVKRDGKPVEELGFYNPITKQFKLNISRILIRLEQGAQPSERIARFLGQAEVIPMPAQRNNPIKAKPKKKAQEKLKAAAEAKKAAEAAPVETPAAEAAPAVEEQKK